MALDNWKEIEKQIEASGVFENNEVENKVQGNCYFCGVQVDSDYYCYGCKEFICGPCLCRSIECPCGPHKIEDHRHPVIDKAFGQD